MARWSLSNYFRAITHEQFVSMVDDFKKASEKSFGTECSLEITALKANKVYTTFADDDLQEILDMENRDNLLLTTDNIEKVSQDLWNCARHVEVKINPVDKSKAPANYAFAYAEFKGNLPRQATFYIQPGGEDAEKDMRSKYKTKLKGDGFESNGRRSFMEPNSWF